MLSRKIVFAGRDGGIFMYEETPDQMKAIEAVKADMESPHVMDRLVWGTWDSEKLKSLFVRRSRRWLIVTGGCVSADDGFGLSTL